MLHKPLYHNFLRLTIAAIILIATSCQPAKLPERKRTGVDVQGLSDAGVQKWKNNKYSMFIHFGVYSALGGVWKGEPVKNGYSEQIKSHAGIFNDQYEEAARHFKPTRWNPDSIASLAKDAGMRSVVITAKHHDGFCLFKTATTPFNIVDFTYYKKDIIEHLANACRKQGLDFGVYFSVIDWHFPPAFPVTSHNADPIPPDHHQLNMEQVRELMTHYGPISEIWFDMGANTPQQSKALADLVHQLQPQCMVSGRVGNDQGDFNVMGDNFYPDFRMEVPWQTPASMFDETWGYRSWQERGSSLEKAKQKLRSFINVISHGGNYLLNIGPTGEGSVVDFEAEVLQHIGRWVKVNKEAIYGTSSSPFSNKLIFGEATQKENKLYLFVDSVPPTNRLQLPGLKNRILSARFLGSGIHVDFNQSGDAREIIWTAPAMADPMQMPVVEVTLEDAPQTVPEVVIEPVENELILRANNALPVRSFTGADYYTLIPSVTAFIWHITLPPAPIEAEITFTDYEKGRTIELISKDSANQTIALEGKAGELIRNKEDSLSVAPPFRSEAFTGALTTVHVNPDGKNRTQVNSQSWTGPDERQAQELPPLPRTSYYYYVEITSENAQLHSFTITGNDGLQVWLNGEELLLNRNMEPGTPMKRTLVLDLDKGANRLLIKNYNRHGTADLFTLESNPGAKWYRTNVPLKAPSHGVSTLTLKAADPQTPHTPLDLPNLRIKIKSAAKKKR